MHVSQYTQDNTSSVNPPVVNIKKGGTLRWTMNSSRGEKWCSKQKLYAVRWCKCKLEVKFQHTNFSFRVLFFSHLVVKWGYLTKLRKSYLLSGRIISWQVMETKKLFVRKLEINMIQIRPGNQAKLHKVTTILAAPALICCWHPIPVWE